MIKHSRNALGMTGGGPGVVPGALPSDTWLANLGFVDEMTHSFHARGGQPGLVAGIVWNGRLVHWVGAGERRTGGSKPDADTVFRIASMTKSFTAAAILMLRDHGKLLLSDPVTNYVPELDIGPGPTDDSGRLTIGHLLMMQGGLPTDDPWGDRQQGLPQEAFNEVLKSGLSFAWSPGTEYEYSNLGYAILGRVVSGASNVSFAEYVDANVIQPLGLQETSLDPSSYVPDVLARGYKRLDGGWEEVPFDVYGAFAPMGGLFSTVRDLCKWIGALSAGFPPRDGLESPEFLSRASRRELQQPHTLIPPERGPHLIDDLYVQRTKGYGFGLFVEEDARFGRVVYHSGGYPGFGTHMRWHPASGIGVVVLANSTYADAHVLGAETLIALLGRIQRVDRSTGSLPGRMEVGLAPRACDAWPATLAAQRVVNRLIDNWDDLLARQLFSDNVSKDRSLSQREEDIVRIKSHVGFLVPDDKLQHRSPAHCAWWLYGEFGSVRAEISLTPERPPRVQELFLRVIVEPSPQLLHTIKDIVGFVNRDTDNLKGLLSPVIQDQQDVMNSLRRMGEWAGRCYIGEWRESDGWRNCVVALEGERGRVVLTIVFEDGLLLELDCRFEYQFGV